MNLRPLLPLEQAIDELVAGVDPLAEIEERTLGEAEGRILARDVHARLDLPPWDNSAMDGYAVRSGDAGRQLPVALRIVAGDGQRELPPDAAARIFTGAPLPFGADAVVMQEDATLIGDEVVLPEAIRPGQHRRPRAQECRSGELLLAAGRRLRPQDIGLLASQGLARVALRRRLRVALISTGSELRDPDGSSLDSGQIYNSNRPMLLALLQRLGCETLDLGNVADSAAATREVLARASEASDLVLSSGGVSVGEEDHVRAAVESLGSIDLWRVAVKPGKPFAHGRIGDCPFMGLPGNPASAFVTFLLLARPWIQARQGRREALPPALHARAGFACDGSARREEYLRVRLIAGPPTGTVSFAATDDAARRAAAPSVDDINAGGEADREAAGNDGVAMTWAAPFENQSSGILRSLVAADALARVPAGTELHRGDAVEILPLDLLLS
ncbi:MAG: gephyrin-like molybdotransferase Glp [Halieaceae bacterium]|jgi:molybdopterin molybdotransferase|nr:gephyrin-like molybdotransferase Glp [Halieaceae bacterium]